MQILIAESNVELGKVWAGHLRRQGAEVDLRHSQRDATEAMGEVSYDLLVVNLAMGEASAIALADYAAYKDPATKVIFVTGSSFFSDGSIFTHCPNACACLPEHTPAKDLAALVEYHLGKVA